eukprot:g16138.t1
MWAVHVNRQEDPPPPSRPKPEAKASAANPPARIHPLDRMHNTLLEQHRKLPPKRRGIVGAVCFLAVAAPMAYLLYKSSREYDDMIAQATHYVMSAGAPPCQILDKTGKCLPPAQCKIPYGYLDLFPDLCKAHPGTFCCYYANLQPIPGMDKWLANLPREEVEKELEAGPTQKPYSMTSCIGGEELWVGICIPEKECKKPDIIDRKAALPCDDAGTVCCYPKPVENVPDES